MNGYGLSITLWFVVGITYSRLNNCKKETVWKDVIPCNYDKHVPPTVNGNPVTVYVKLQIMDVDEIREDTMEFRMHLYVTEYWRDPRLKFSIINITKWHTIPTEIVEDMWLPDVIFDNSKWEKSFLYSLPNIAARINSHHTIARFARYSFRVSCPMKLQDFPMDIQHCGFKMTFFLFTDKEALLQWSGHHNSPYKKYGTSITLTEDIQPLKYEMLTPKPYQITAIWDGGNFSCLVANFTFIRRLTGNIINVYVPSTLVVALSWLSFWLSISAVPARITLGVTSILTLVTQVLQSRSHMPPVNYIKALDIWLFFCISMVTASLVEYAIAYQHPIKAAKKEEQDKVRVKIPISSTKEWAVPSNLVPKREIPSKEENNANGVEICKSSKKLFWKCFCREKSTNHFDYYCRFLFPTSFIVFAVSYWIHYLGRRNSFSKNFGVTKSPNN